VGEFPKVEIRILYLYGIFIVDRETLPLLPHSRSASPTRCWMAVQEQRGLAIFPIGAGMGGTGKSQEGVRVTGAFER
jgi:hypothetical protein